MYFEELVLFSLVGGEQSRRSIEGGWGLGLFFGYRYNYLAVRREDRGVSEATDLTRQAFASLWEGEGLIFELVQCIFLEL